MGNSAKWFAPGTVVEPQVFESETELDDLTSSFAIHCSQIALDQMREHAKSFSNTEIFGLLLGHVYKSPSGRLRTLIEDFIPAKSFYRTTLSSVEVSPQELLRMDRIYEQLQEKRGFLKVGWFHTHPGHGIFMSHTDKDNHRMYSKNWQVALVIDPVQSSYGFFWGPTCAQIGDIVYFNGPFNVQSDSSRSPASATTVVGDDGVPSSVKHRRLTAWCCECLITIATLLLVMARHIFGLAARTGSREVSNVMTRAQKARQLALTIANELTP